MVCDVCRRDKWRAFKGEEKVLGQTFIETEVKHQLQQSAVGHDFEARHKSLSCVHTDPLHPVYTGCKYGGPLGRRPGRKRG